MSEKRKPLIKKITNRLLIVGLVPLAALALISVLLSWLSYLNSNTVFEETLLQQKRSEVQREVQRRVEILEIFVGYDEVLPINDDGQLFLIEGLLDVDPDLMEVAIIQTLDTREIPAGVETQRCVRVEEEVDCSVPHRNRIDDQPFIVAREGAPYIGPVLWSDGIPSVVIASDIRNKSKTDSIGVIVGILDLSSLQVIFDEAGFGGVGSVFLTDSSGLVLAHSDGSQFHERSAQHVLVDIAESGARVLPAAFSDLKSFTSGIPLKIENQTWFLVAEWPLLVTDWPPSGAFVDVVFLAFQFFMVGLLLLLVVRFIALRFSKSIVRPIRLVTAGAQRIGKGQFDQRLELHTDDEMEDLGDALNLMAEDLERLQKVRLAETRAQALAAAVLKEHQLDEEKDTLLATASHQFRTPVTALNWNIDLLRTMKLPGEATELLDGLKEHTQNLATIASDLLNATAFGPGYRAVPDAQPVDMNKVIKETVERFATRAKEKSLTMNQQLPEPALMLRGSYAAIRIAVEQLIGNAILYSDDKGTVDITLGMTPEGRAAVQVVDQGIGIPQDEQQFLFNPFFRAKNAITKKNVGTGLGLFIAFNVVSGHGGSLDVVSEEGRGTTVTMQLPAQGSDPTPEAGDTKQEAQE